ncbi:MAG: hypothetical protein R3B13_26600 [Polyangiaceae bacterium]
MNSSSSIRNEGDALASERHEQVKEALVVAVLLLAACGSDDDTSGGGGKGGGGGTSGASGNAGSGGGSAGASGGSAGGNTGGAPSGGTGGASGGASGSAGGGGVPGVVPGLAWTPKTPTEVGLTESALSSFSASIGGRGVVVKDGYLAYTWGNASQKGDIASAAKPIYGFFLFKAVEQKLLPSIDAKAAPLIPGLAALNPSLGNKDASISFRHFATQTSCYGVSEDPGTAFDYNDWQMALFWDTLFLQVWKATYDDVDSKLLGPELCSRIDCQDAPTFLAFGKNDRAGRVSISPRDFARFALLYLRGGSWNGTTLLPASTITEIVTSPLPNSIPQTQAKEAQMLAGQRSIGSNVKPDNQTDHLGSYSFMWWMNGVDRNGKRLLPSAPTDTYMAAGHGGKRSAVVIPSKDMVVSWNDTNIDSFDKVDAALKLLLAAVK